MNRDAIKYIAMFTMLLNHIANIFLDPGTLLFTVLVDKEQVCPAAGCVCTDI